LTSFPQLRVLHVSDLHFGRYHVCNPPDPTGAAAGIPLLRELLRKDLESEEWKKSIWAYQAQDAEPVPLLIAATGDFAQVADPGEFDQAHDFLDVLVQEPILGSTIDLRDVFVVPGNHDVVFDRSEPEHRFAPYCNFYNKLFQSIQPEQRALAYPHEASSLSQIHAYPEVGFLIAEINSCFYVERETIDESRGHVDHRTIASLRQKLEEYNDEAKQWIKIALVHHHPVLLPSFIEPGRDVDSILNAKSLLRLLREHGFQLILHGHKHFPQVFSYDPDSAWAKAEASIPQMVVAGGSCGSIALPEGTRKSNTYNLITVKWNAKALQARIQVVTRGLTRTGSDGELDPDQWRWRTLRVFDKILSPYENLPLPSACGHTSFPQNDDSLEEERNEEYTKLRQNMPVVEVLPSLEPGQGYEARVWLERHRYHQESPQRVVWSAGRMFEREVCEADAAPDFCTSFHYWGPMLIQAQLEFEDGEQARAYVYAHLPDATMRR
jgi:3',5'-cyclic AMP phosphodiesterase CpdA